MPEWLTPTEFRRRYRLRSYELRRLLDSHALTYLHPAGTSSRRECRIQDPEWTSEQCAAAVCGTLPSPDVDQVVYTTSEAAAVLGISTNWTIQLARLGKLDCIWQDGRRRYTHSSLIRYAQEMARVKAGQSRGSRLRRALVTYGLKAKAEAIAEVEAGADPEGFDRMIDALRAMPRSRQRKLLARIMEEYRSSPSWRVDTPHG